MMPYKEHHVVPFNHSTHIYHARCAKTSDTRGTTASRPVKMRSTTTTGFVHKEVQGGISRTHHIRKVTLIIIQILQINLP